MLKLAKKILFDERGFFRSSGYRVPPVQTVDTEEQSSLAETAAAKEREEIRKKRRPTLLTGAKGITGEASVYRPQLIGSQAGKTQLGA